MSKLYVLDAIRAHLKARQLTYKDLALGLGLSETSVKRLFASADCSLERLEQICQFLQLEFADLFRSAPKKRALIAQLTHDQEVEFATHRHLLMVAVCALNRWKVPDMWEHLHISPDECRRLLWRLDDIGFLEMQTEHQYRLRVPVLAEVEQLKARRGRQLSVHEALAVLRAGLFDVGQLGSSPRSLMGHTLSATDDGLRPKAYRWSGGVWASDPTYPMNGVSGYQAIWWPSLSDRPSWQQGLGFPMVKSYGPEMVEMFSASSTDWGPSNGLGLVERDLSGLPYRAVPALAGLSGQFGPGHKGYQTRRVAYLEGFVLDGITPFFTSLAEFRDNPRTCSGGLCWRITMAASGPDGDQLGSIAFSTPVNAGSVDLGVGIVVGRRVEGVAVLDVTSVPIEVQNRSAFWSTKDGRNPVFAEIGGRVWHGRFAMSGAVWYSELLLPPSVLNAVLATAGLGEVRP